MAPPFFLGKLLIRFIIQSLNCIMTLKLLGLPPILLNLPFIKFTAREKIKFTGSE